MDRDTDSNTNAHAGMTTLTLILGASDPEMTAIEDLGRQVGADVRAVLEYDATQ